MNILLISRCPPYPLYLGDRLIIYHLAEELGKRGHTLDLLALADRPEDWDEIGIYAEMFRHVALFPASGRSVGDYVRRWLNPAARFPRDADAAWSSDMWRAIEARLTTHEYDVIHVFGGIQVYEFAHLLRDHPTIITPYESYSLYLRRQVARESAWHLRAVAWARWQVARAFERWMFDPYGRTVVVSERDQAELATLNSALPVRVIPNGVDLAAFDASAEPTRDPHMILFVGNYEYPPNVDAALYLVREVLPRVRERVPDAQLWLVGNAPPDALLALAGESVHVTGRVPDVRPYLARAAVFASALRFGAGIKNKVLEALAMGCPVVATPLSVDGIAVRDGEDIVIADEAAFAAAVAGLLADAPLRDQLSSNGRHVIEMRYSWAHVAAAYEALYAEVIADRS